VRALLADRAAELYMGAGNPAPLAAFDVSSTQQLGSRSAYGAAAADQDEKLMDDARVAIEELGLEQKSLAKARARAESERNALDAMRQEINDATAQQEALLAQANGRSRLSSTRSRPRRNASRKPRRARRWNAPRRPSKPKHAPRRARPRTVRRQRFVNGIERQLAERSAAPGSPGAELARAGRGRYRRSAARQALCVRRLGTDSFDCSGLTMYAWAAAGVSLPHNADAQYQSLPHVPMEALEPGDLVFYGSPIHHVGMFVGNGTMIEAPYTGVNVRYHTIYRSDFAGAARP
jgi:cell wall-associated NlpC family hydrolase